MLENVYDTLVEPDADLDHAPGARGVLGRPRRTSWCGHSSCGRGVTFHDGSPFTADDVVYSYRRIIDEELTNVDKFSADHRCQRHRRPHRARSPLARPTPNLLTNLGGFKGMAIVQRANVEDGQIATHPVGTGPFAFAGQKSGDSITLRANERYWGGAPKIPG